MPGVPKVPRVKSLFELSVPVKALLTKSISTLLTSHNFKHFNL
jgi:hypothetical protein